jgi:hypothetical protein
MMMMMMRRRRRRRRSRKSTGMIDVTKQGILTYFQD